MVNGGMISPALVDKDAAVDSLTSAVSHSCNGKQLPKREYHGSYFSDPYAA